ncbi:MAG: sensor domain-containing diguanylate cyclase [Vicinamibacterales bacterium]
MSIRARADAYAAWVRALRSSHTPPPLPTDSRDPLGVLARELTLLVESLAGREQQLMWLLDVIGSLEKGIRFDEVLDHIYSGFRGLIPYDRIGCALLRDNGRVLAAAWTRSELGPVCIKAGFEQPVSGNSLESVFTTGQPRIINDLEAYLAAKPHSESTKRIVAEGGRSSLTCPLIIDGVPLGVLFFTSREPGAYTPDHQAIFRQIATQVALVIQRSRSYDDLLASNHRLVEQTQRLHVVATMDPLTGVLNRRAIEAALSRAWRGWQEAGTPFGLIMCDIDHFKAVNDTHGHPAGDAVLRAVASCASSIVRPTDAFGRYGGEEFLIVVNQCARQADVHALANRLRAAVEAVRVPDLGLDVTASFGAVHGSHADSAEALVRMADAALYEAKRTGRNRVVLA